MQSISRTIPSITRTCARSFYRRPLQTTPLLNCLQAEHLPAIRQAIRYNSSASPPDAIPNITAAKPHRPAPHRDPNTPVYELTFTCKACTHRSSHTVSKQGYHKGTTIITCPGCKNLHLISDHLRVRLIVGRFVQAVCSQTVQIFTDKSTTLEDLLREKGQSMRKGSIDAEGNIEYWADESGTNETPSAESPKAIGSS